MQAGVAATVLALAPGAFEAAVTLRPSLGVYAFEIDKIRRDAGHMLAPDQQLVLDQLADPALSALWSLYRQTLRSTPFARIGTRDARSDRKQLLTDADPATRASANRAWFDGYATREAIYAGILLDIVDTGNRVARLEHFDDAPAQKYFAGFLSVADVKATLAAVAAHADLNRRFQTLEAAHIAAASGLATVHSWDLAAPAGGFAAPRFTLEQVRASAHDALAPLGSDYVARMDALLDPRNRRADIAAGGGSRDGGGFSVGFVGMPTALYVGDYQGLLGNAATVVHEGGHAIHRELMNASGVSPFYASGPHWMFEAFAILNELLLEDRLYRTATDPRAKAYYLHALVQEMAFQVFTSAEEGALEQSIYDGVAAGRITDGAGLDALTLATLKDYDIWPATEPEQAHLWMTKSLMFEDPLYLVNYLYAGLLATRLYEMALADPAGFAPRYRALQAGGFDAPPDALLAKFFGRPTRTDALVPGAMAIIGKKTAELEALYRTLDAAKRGR